MVATAEEKSVQSATPETPVEPEPISAGLESMKFLLLGATAAPIPGMNVETDAGLRYGAILLTKPTTQAEVLDTLSMAPDPAVPIADFVGAHPVRSDFVASKLDTETVAEMKKQFAPIWRRLEKIPFKAKREERDPMTLLRLIYSRNTPAKAQYSPDQPVIVQYPLLGDTVGLRRELEVLANMGLLERRHFARTHACGKCGSSRLNVYEACPACNSADLVEEPLIHHYRCGCQEPESHFRQGLLLICPKCRRELRHLGVDYGKPGAIVVCRSCGAENSNPVVNFACLDCFAVTPAERAATTDWYDYDLTEAGIAAMREGRLPRLQLEPQAEHGARAYSLGEFQLLATQELQVARQYGRPFSTARITFPNIEAVRRDLGPAAFDTAYHGVVDKIVATIRASDFVGLGGDNSVVIAFPETTAGDLAAIEQAIRLAVHEAGSPLELEFSIAEGDAAVAMFAGS
jgi:hypothetical protein